MKTIEKVTNDWAVLVSNGIYYEINFSKIRETNVKKYHWRIYWAYGSANRSKSWLTKLVDRLILIDKKEIDKLPQDIVKKMKWYIADGWYYGKYDNLRAF